MTYIRELKESLADIHAIGGQFAVLAETRPEGWRVKLVQARRAMAEALDRFSALLVKEEAGSQLPMPDLTQLRDAASQFRTTLALHQANFPASSIDDSEAYRKSGDAVRNAGVGFMEAAHRILS